LPREEYTLVRPPSLVISFPPRRRFARPWKGRYSHFISLHSYLRDADTLSRHHSAYDRGARKSSIRATGKYFKWMLSLLMQGHTYVIVAAFVGSPSTFAIPTQWQIVASIFHEALRITTTDGFEQSRASFSASR
jgi:hypothetical protein